MSVLDTLAFEPGQQVECKTRYDDVFRGEVVAFDLSSKVLIIKSPTSPELASSTKTSANAISTTAAPTSTKSAVSASSNSNHDLHCLVLNSVSEVEVLEEAQPGKCSNDLPVIGMKSVNAKCSAAINERFRLVEAVENGVSQDGISLYKSISKTYSEMGWKDKVKIEVMNSVVISPPYKEMDCRASSNSKADERAVIYVKSLVGKFWDDNSKQKSATTTSAQQQAATEPSTSSSSSTTTTATTTPASTPSTNTTTSTSTTTKAANKTPAGPTTAPAAKTAAAASS